MVDSLGYRAKFAVLAPSTNTSVQPEFDAMRPPGVTNHLGRMVIPDLQIRTNEDFDESIRLAEERAEAFLKTLRIPLGRYGAPEDIGAATVFLASPASSWITGQCLYVTGGA